MQRNDWSLKLAQSGANEPEEQRYHPGRQQLPHKLADFVFWLTRLENETRAMPEQKTYTAKTTRELLTPRTWATKTRQRFWRPSDQRERVLRFVSGDKHTTLAALPPSDAEQRQPCAKLKT